jgi:hypothetical protein
VWVLAIVMAGDAAAVRKSVVDLYQAHGFTVDPHAYIPVILSSAAYKISVTMFARDHSPTETDVALQVTRR